MRPIDRPSRSMRLQSLPLGIGLTVTSTLLSRWHRLCSRTVECYG